MLKKLTAALVAAGALAIATPTVFACPNMDEKETKDTSKTADKAKEKQKDNTAKQKEEKPKDTAKTGDAVSKT